MTSDTELMQAKPDFPDWISPMLVKELRQGMRSRTFLMLFIALQGAMILLALIGLLNASTASQNTGVTAFYWIIIGIPLLLGMPASGLGSIASEKTGNTLEPIFLTRLTARRIVFGKWVAIVGQMLLLVSAILPYTVLRYYLGSVNLIAEVEALGWVILGSALLVAVTVGLSPTISRAGRILLPIILVFFLTTGSGIVSSMLTGGVVRTSGGSSDGLKSVMLVLLGGLFGAFMMEVGAGRIAPGAENHSTPKRLIGLVAVLAMLLYSYWPGAQQWLWIPTLTVAAMTMVGAVCEPVRGIPSVYRPFARRGFAGRALGRLLYPGWPAGCFFAGLLFCIVLFRLDHLAGGSGAGFTGSAVALGRHSWGYSISGGYRPAVSSSALTFWIAEMAFVGALFLPIAIYHMMRIRKKWPAIGFFIAFQAIFAVLSLLGAIVTSYSLDRATPSGIQLALACIPTGAICYSSVIDGWDLEAKYTVFSSVSAITASSILILLVRMKPAWRTISALEKKARGLQPSASPPDALQSSAEA